MTKNSYQYRCLLCGDNIWFPGTLLDFDAHYIEHHKTPTGEK